MAQVPTFTLVVLKQYQGQVLKYHFLFIAAFAITLLTVE
jgi:hypothetical protein